MKKILLLVCLVLSPLTYGLAQSNDGNYLGESFEFAAPVVNGSPSTTDNRIGSIVFDLYTHTFRGLFDNGSWGSITTGTLKAPTIQKFTTSSGTYTLPSGVLYLRVRMIGAGGGGGGSGTTDGSAAGNGGNTTLGTSFLTANGGSAGVRGANAGGGAGGGASASLGSSGTVSIAVKGNYGHPGGTAVSGEVLPGASGGAGALGGAGTGSVNNVLAVGANSGAGGAGGGFSGAGSSGSGGGAGGYIEVIITSPSSTYNYSVGAGGSAGGSGTSGFAGGAGSDGLIEVTEFYQ